ncbi:type VI secretion system baseplate subunit TssE [Allorhizobium taibaishanense]|uniref:Type VI secretion protein n=1 Tax=Allorhizobium taibaishanense TaxID=887144 RepID=A0A1Q9A9U9_9HYPH|nr:type VI secretion system baseplate subunit TssE [Allorhizobium taibaishanense]MBB4010024.1 type VI secretion system protein ImpF [Allorhizobium taibaishanense]OLP51635.1 type VI secretion protein [Allorhizobium taibaishanense]
MVDPLQRFRPSDRVYSRSVLDRLLDDTPDLETDQQISPSEQVREMRELIRRDLEALLNTRRCPQAPPEKLGELQDALVSYGVDGILSASLVTDESKLRLARLVERRIALFETRLTDVKVTILKGSNEGDRALRMRIQASFRLHDGMPPVSFESRIDPSTQAFRIEASNG